MEDTGLIEGEALERLLPHRGVNMFIDSERLSTSEEGSGGESTVTVEPSRGDGRAIFLRESASGPVIIEPALAEHLALNAICVLAPDMARGEIAFFSLISEFEFPEEAPAGKTLTGTVRRLRDKGRFRRFEGEVRLPGGGIAARGEIMAYTAEPLSTEKRETAKLLVPPRQRESKPVDRAIFWWKRPEMVFIDERIDVTEGLAGATFRYTYPPTHPFCPGHFPGNPVMMGITQWIAVADAAYALAVEAAETRAGQTSEFVADADIIRESGSLIAEVRQLAFELRKTGARWGPMRFKRTRRVGFRDQVRPGEVLYVRVQVSAT